MVSTFRVETEDDEVEFIITISNGRRCKATQDPGRGDEGFCSEDNSNPNDKDDKIEGKKGNSLPLLTASIRAKW